MTLSDGRRVSGRAVVLATGAYRRLGVPELEELSGAGVYYGGPISEGHALSGRDAYVVGGANSAGQAVLHLARYARRVTLVVRSESLGEGMSHYLVREVEDRRPAQHRLAPRRDRERREGFVLTGDDFPGDRWPLARAPLRSSSCTAFSGSS